MTHCCLLCRRKISSINLKNLQCKICEGLCHPKCARELPPIRLKKSGRFRYKVVRNPNWQCECCRLKELPFYDVSNSQIKEMVVRQDRILPSCEDLNSLFSIERYDRENSKDQMNFLNESKYVCSSNIETVNFSDMGESIESFPIVSLNIRSIVNRTNFSKFEAFLASLSIKPMIIAVNETWIKTKSKGPYSKIEGYNFVQNCRKKKTGGGVAFYVAEHLHFTKIESLSIMEEKVFESLFINIEIDGKKCICGTVYRSPKQNHGTFSKTLRDVMKETCK